MRILVPAIGSRGDVQPYIALCLGLKTAGHDATLATNPTLVPLVESYGIQAAPIGQPVDMGAVGAQIYEQSGGNMYLGIIRTMSLGMKMVAAAHPDVLKLAAQTDLVISTDTGAGPAEADHLGKPWISVTLQPARVPTPNQKISPLVRLLAPLYNALTMAPINKFRRKIGAPRLADMGAMLSKRLVLVPVSPRVHKPDPRWDACVQMTGYWNTPAPAGWTPPADLLRFLEAGEPPVVISLGAMSLSGERTREAARISLESIRQAGIRAIIQGWDEALSGVSLPESVFHAGSLPHAWLFERVCAVVHHGGFGTTAAGLRAGLPSIVIPHIIDQMYWADRVYRLGAGPRYIPRGKLNAENLTAALRQASDDTAIRARAAEIGAAIRAEPDGVQAAVRLVELAL